MKESLQLLFLALSILIPGISRGSAEIISKNAVEFCAMLSSPGDLILKHASSSQRREYLVYASVIDIMNYKLPLMRYGHTEIITQIEEGMLIRTRGYNPRVLGDKDSQVSLVRDPQRDLFTGELKVREYDQYTTSDLSVYRMKTSLQEREMALLRSSFELLDPDGFRENGVCSDWANWVEGDFAKGIHADYPVLGEILKKYYPPDRIQTPEQLAQSPLAEKVCSFVSGQITFPKKDVTINSKTFVKNLGVLIHSSNFQIQSHAIVLTKKLQEAGILGPQGEILQNEFVLKLPKKN